MTITSQKKFSRANQVRSHLHLTNVRHPPRTRSQYSQLRKINRPHYIDHKMLVTDPQNATRTTSRSLSTSTTNFML